MQLDLSGSCGKLERALVHLNELGDEMEEVERRARRSITLADQQTSPHPKGSYHHFRIGELFYPRPAAALVVGDYVQNLRAALDHLAWEMVRRGNRPSHSPTAVQFPIYDIAKSKKTGRGKPKTFENQVQNNLPGITREQRAFVDGYQPYHRGNWHLAALANLSNQDKHRLITPVHLFASEIEGHHLRSTKGKILAWKVLLPLNRRVNERTPVLEVLVDEPDADVEMYSTIKTLVAFQERPGRYHRPVALESIGEKVAEIVGESASRWGNSADAAFCVEWLVRAREALALEGPPDS